MIEPGTPARQGIRSTRQQASRAQHRLVFQRTKQFERSTGEWRPAKHHTIMKHRGLEQRFTATEHEHCSGPRPSRLLVATRKQENTKQTTAAKPSCRNKSARAVTDVTRYCFRAGKRVSGRGHYCVTSGTERTRGDRPVPSRFESRRSNPLGQKSIL